MTDHTTPILSLPLIAAAQAQKHVTHNEALAQLDVLTQLAVSAFDAETPPAVPTPGDVYALGAAPTGAWAGQAEGALAAYLNGGWVFITPQPGWIAGDAGTGETRTWHAGAWQAGGVPEVLPRLGINAGADDTNRLSVNADATLLNNAGAGHQLKLNKASATDTASLLFQSAFSGRAEMGTAGTDDFSIKVSADGGTWNTALEVDAGTGQVHFPSGSATRTRFPITGRWDCYTNAAWAGFHSQFGHEGGQHNNSCGTGAEPNVNWSYLGLPLAGGAVLHALSGLVRVNASDVTALDMRVCAQYGLPDGTHDSNADITRDTLWSVDGHALNGTGFGPLSADLGGYTMPRDGMLLIFVRPQGTLAAKRSAYLSTALDMVLPA